MLEPLVCGAAPEESTAEPGCGARGGNVARLRTAIIIGSIRQGRKAESVANWIYEVARSREDAEFELVDLQSFGLPFAEEPGLAERSFADKAHALAVGQEAGFALGVRWARLHEDD